MASAAVDDGARGDTMLGVVELRKVDAEAAAASRARIADAHNDAHRRGVDVDRIAFSSLEAAAAGFLVAEATLDEAG